MEFNRFIFTPLHELDADITEITDIRDNFFILPNSGEVSDIINSARKNSDFISENDFLNYVRPSKYFLAIKVNEPLLATLTDIKKIENNARELKLYLIALRLLTPISSSGRICIYHYDGNTFSMSNQTRIYVSPKYQKQKIRFIALNEAAQIYSRMKLAESKQPNRLLTSILYFEMAQKGYQLLERYLNAVIALESIFNTDVFEMTHQVCERVALLVGDNAEEREHIFANMKRAYVIRSKIAHGQLLPTKEFQKNPGLIDVIESYFRRTIMKIMKEADLFDLFSSKKAKNSADIRSFFEKMIFSK